MDKRLEELKAEYRSIPIPKELDEVVNRALQTQPKKRKLYRRTTALVAAAAILFSVTVNLSPALASTLSEIPVIGKMIDIITITEYKDTKNNSSIDIKTPAITGLEDSKLEENLNSKYIAESKLLYQEFEKSMASIEEGQNGNMAVSSSFEVLTDNERILSIRRFTEISQASTFTEYEFDTIDKENEVLITLKSLFKDDRYIDVISREIIKQMEQQMEQDSNKIYWLQEDEPTVFKQIKEDQDFYINAANKLVISFDEYEVGPGYMGAVEFVIPTDAISKILVGNMYIQ